MSETISTTITPKKLMRVMKVLEKSSMPTENRMGFIETPYGRVIFNEKSVEGNLRALDYLTKNTKGLGNN